MTIGRIWEPVEPLHKAYAQCWLRSPQVCLDEVCPKCKTGTKYMMPTPLAFEWEAGSDRVGDFIWPGGGRAAVIEHVAHHLAEKGLSVKAGPIEMVQDPKLKKPKNPRRAKPRVWLPYEGPPVVELVVDHYVHIRPETTTQVRSTCAVCGRVSRNLVGGENKQRRWSQEMKDLVPIREPRIPGKGLFVSRDELGAAGLFRTYEFPYAIFCTDEVKALFEKAQFTNLDFLECGEAL